jgi:hypothetical protein
MFIDFHMRSIYRAELKKRGNKKCEIMAGIKIALLLKTFMKYYELER